MFIICQLILAENNNNNPVDVFVCVPDDNAGGKTGTWAYERK